VLVLYISQVITRSLYQKEKISQKKIKNQKEKKNCV